jgi:hypothetical protein
MWRPSREIELTLWDGRNHSGIKTVSTLPYLMAEYTIVSWYMGEDMALRRGLCWPVSGVLSTLVLLLVAVIPAQGERITVATPLGSLKLPDTWATEEVSDSVFTARSLDTSAKITLSEQRFEPLSEYLYERANELRISGYVRKVAEKYQNIVGADRGGFIQGLTPENNNVAAVYDPSEWADIDWVEIEGVSSRYLFVVAYEANRRLFIMEAETSTVSGGTLLLSEIHRSWMLPQMSISE